MRGTILFSERIHGIMLEIGQEWPGAGLYWAVRYPAGIADSATIRRSSGRFYPDQHGETIHGATLADVIQTARRAAYFAHGLGTVPTKE